MTKTKKCSNPAFRKKSHVRKKTKRHVVKSRTTKRRVVKSRTTKRHVVKSRTTKRRVVKRSRGRKTRKKRGGTNALKRWWNGNKVSEMNEQMYMELDKKLGFDTAIKDKDFRSNDDKKIDEILNKRSNIYEGAFRGVPFNKVAEAWKKWNRDKYLEKHNKRMKPLRDANEKQKYKDMGDMYNAANALTAENTSLFHRAIALLGISANIGPNIQKLGRSPFESTTVNELSPADKKVVEATEIAFNHYNKTIIDIVDSNDIVSFNEIIPEENNHAIISTNQFTNMTKPDDILSDRGSIKKKVRDMIDSSGGEEGEPKVNMWFVCSGNTCRSPSLLAYMNSVVDEVVRDKPRSYSSENGETSWGSLTTNAGCAGTKEPDRLGDTNPASAPGTVSEKKDELGPCVPGSGMTTSAAENAKLINQKPGEPSMFDENILQNYKSKNLLRIDGTIEPSLLSQINDAMNPDQSTPPVKFLFGFANDDVPKRLAARVQEAIDFLENTPADALGEYYKTAAIITGIADRTVLDDGTEVEKIAGDNGILAKQAFNPSKMSDIKTYKYLLDILKGIDTDAETYVLGIDDPYQEAEFWEELARENGITISEAKSGPYQTMLTSIQESVSEHLGLGDSLP